MLAHFNFVELFTLMILSYFIHFFNELNYNELNMFFFLTRNFITIKFCNRHTSIIYAMGIPVQASIFQKPCGYATLRTKFAANMCLKDFEKQEFDINPIKIQQ